VTLSRAHLHPLGIERSGLAAHANHGQRPVRTGNQAELFSPSALGVRCLHGTPAPARCVML
jgi:hypothetical protein